jgi:hypothetical protein
MFRNHVGYCFPVVICLLLPAAVYGHFVWVARSATDGKVHIYFAEEPVADQVQFLAGLNEMEVWSVDKSSVATPLKYAARREGNKGSFECNSDLPLTRVDAYCRYGLFTRGDTGMFLNYAAKYIEYQSPMKFEATGKLPIDIAVETGAGKVVFQVLKDTKPAADSEIVLVDDDGETHELKTDSQGKFELQRELKNRWLVRAKLVEQTAGEVDGKSYGEIRHYCTLVLSVPQTQAATKVENKNALKMSSTSHVSVSNPLPEIPVGITSFGGAVVGKHLYFFGGHIGDAHDYYNSGQNRSLYKLDISNPSAWEVVMESNGLQGLAMVEHGGNLYRVGGFSARNQQGEKQDLHSVDEFARLNLQTNSWELLQPLPKPRSSLDAVVVGDKLFVVGGWTLRGPDQTEWCDDSVWIDLSDPNARWQVLKTPFQRRALSLGFVGERIYCVGGMNKQGGPTPDVEVYDIASGNWSHGPALPGTDKMEGFGSSCFNVGGRLIASTYSGNVLILNKQEDGWEQLWQLDVGRFFHRLLPLSSNKFALVGGANMDEGKQFDIPVFELH